MALYQEGDFMQIYADIIKSKTDPQERVRLFAEYAEFLDLTGRDLEIFAEECGFKLAIGVTRS